MSSNVDDPGRLFDLLCRLGGVGIMQPELALALVCFARPATGRDKHTHTHTHIHIRSSGHGQIYTESALAEFRFHEVSWRCQQQEPVSVVAQVQCLAQAVRGDVAEVIGVCLRLLALPDP